MDFLNRILAEWNFVTTNPTALPALVFWLLTGAVVVQLIFYWGVYARIIFHKIQTPGINAPKPPVSIVIAARDEYMNLYDNLPAVLEQEYPNFEVIVVNNDSTDDSATLLRNFQQQYPHLKVINLERNLNFFKGKKFPLSLGIQSAKNDILIFTDADCKPATPHWLEHMQSGFVNDTGIVLGIGLYNKKPGFLNHLIRFETFMIAMQYLGFALAGIPYMGIGRNLAYRKSLFIREKGFISHYRIPSGDDDLFVNRAASNTSLNIRIHPDAHTFSRPVNRLMHYVIQKRRHVSTAKHYKPLHKTMLAISGLTQLLFFSTLIISFALHKILIITGVLFLLKWISQIILLKKTAKKLRIELLYVFSPLFEFSLMLLHLVVATANLFGKPGKWK
jgi:poly-beta-1,6-N-acetyl-D-glucosamine synthase